MFFRKKLPENNFTKVKDKVSILICSPNFESKLAKGCIESVKKHTKDIDYELIMLENGHFGDFKHPYDINRAMTIAKGEYFVTLDDDVEVTEGWLSSMLDLVGPDVGAIGCVSLNLEDKGHFGTIRHVGGFVRKDGSVYQYNKEISEPISVPYVCSACMLIVNRDIKFPIFYNKYFHEAHYCLENWSVGKRILVSPHKVYHYGGGTMESLGHSRESINSISDKDRDIFLGYWNKGDRLDKLYSRIGKEISFPID